MTDPASRLPDYDLLATLLRESGAEMSPAEAHGVLTGALCAPGDVAPAWRPLILESGEEAASAALFEQLEELEELTRALLEGSEFDFEPLLPGEEAGLSGQLAGFTDWCRGFLLGLAAGGLADPRALSAEVTEFLQDVVQMSEAELEAEGTDAEGEERALAELVEYLRAGVQILYEERQAGRALH